MLRSHPVRKKTRTDSMRNPIYLIEKHPSKTEADMCFEPIGIGA